MRRVPPLVAALVLAGCGQITPGGLTATASAQGTAAMVTGPKAVDMSSTAPADGRIDIRTTDVGDRWSHLQNTDTMDVRAEWRQGSDAFTVRIDRAMPRHPEGKYTTWLGVAYHHAQHGKTGIGTSDLPKMEPELSLWGYAEVTMNGKVVSANAPAHVMVSEGGPMPGVMLEVAGEDRSLQGVRDGYLTVHWPQVGSLVMPDRETFTRAGLGWAVLVALVLWFGWLATREPRSGAPAARVSRPGRPAA